METAIWMILMVGVVVGGFLTFALIAVNSEKKK